MPKALVKVTGLKELRRDLKAIGDKDVIKQLRAVNAKVAALVIDKAKGNASTKLQVRAAGTLKPASSDTAGVRFGGIAGAMGAEFGAYRDQVRNTRRGLVHGWNQFEPWRGAGENAGYFLWPAIREESPQIAEVYADELMRLFDRLGDVGGSE